MATITITNLSAGIALPARELGIGESTRFKKFEAQAGAVCSELDQCGVARKPLTSAAKAW